MGMKFYKVHVKREVTDVFEVPGDSRKEAIENAKAVIGKPNSSDIYRLYPNLGKSPTAEGHWKYVKVEG